MILSSKRITKPLISLVCADAQAGLRLCCSQTHEEGLVTTLPKYYPVAKDLMISTLLISLQIDLQDIKERFESKYEKSLYDVVKDECSGHFMRLLLCIINGSYVEPE